MLKLLLIGGTAVASSLLSFLALVAPNPVPTSPIAIDTPPGVAASIGLNPEAMAAAGLSAQQASTVIANLATSSALVSELQNADISATSAASTLTTAQEQARGPFATEQSPAAVAAAVAAFEQAIAVREEARIALVNAATAGLTSEAKARLAAITAASLHSVPTSFMVLTRTPEEWTTIEEALRAEARATRMEMTLAESHASLLAGTRADAGVIAAQASLTSNLAAIAAVVAAGDAVPPGP